MRTVGDNLKRYNYNLDSDSPSILKQTITIEVYYEPGDIDAPNEWNLARLLETWEVRVLAFSPVETIPDRYNF